jgi:acetyl-CoA carboxylase carboxyl transferase subunit alpha
MSSVISRVRRPGGGQEPEIIDPDQILEPTAWDRVKIARNPDRPHTLDYIDILMTDFVELHGDRSFGDDHALIGGLANFAGRTVMVMGHQKGRDTKENLHRNFGMARPEGYRKAERLMRHAEKFGIPVVTFIDTPGAEPGIGSEERGQSTAIAESLLTMCGLKTIVIAVVIGEGGSGGALAIGIADRVLMLENAIYSVASPEAPATILWKDVAKAADAAERMKITAADLQAFGIIDDIIAEKKPAHEQPREVVQRVGKAIQRHLNQVDGQVQSEGDYEGLLQRRYQKFRAIGAWTEA